jgi:hypothetical protein
VATIVCTSGLKSAPNRGGGEVHKQSQSGFAEMKVIIGIVLTPLLIGFWDEHFNNGQYSCGAEKIALDIGRALF